MNSKNLSKKPNNKVIVIVGPTGSGKTGVAVKIAKKIGGEIISADSRAIYKGMDIGTAKPSVEEQDGVPHFGIDLVEPGERFTVADFKAYAEQKISEIEERGHVPIIAGGTGLYVDALIYDYKFTEQSKKSCSDRDKIEQKYLIFGIKVERNELRERLKRRIEKMFREELFEETRVLVEKYGWDNQAMKSDIYEFVWKYLQGELDLSVAKEQAFYEDYHLAKRQMTWFKRNKNIIWASLEKIESTVLKYIQNEQRK